jgi:hypothetical protein
MSELTSSVAVAGLARACRNHADTLANQVCVGCRRSYCESCVSPGSDFAMRCKDCTSASRRLATLVAVAAGVFAAAIVASGVAYVVTRPPEIVYQEAFVISQAEARFAVAPCSEQSAVEFVAKLNREHDYARVIRIVDEFNKNCAPVPRLRWESHGARMQVQDFQGAVADADVLIADAPGDSDFYGWRAEAKTKLGDFDGAVADLRKASDVAPNAIWPAIKIASLFEKMNRPCDGVQMLSYVLKNEPESANNQNVDVTLDRLIRGGCADPLAGIPEDQSSMSVPCSTLPSALRFEVPTSATAMLENLWVVRTRGIAQGKAVVCRLDIEKNDRAFANLFSLTGALTCTGFVPVVRTAARLDRLSTEKRLAAIVLENATELWCRR